MEEEHGDTTPVDGINPLIRGRSKRPAEVDVGVGINARRTPASKAQVHPSC
jgi:hypothetical protein